MIISNSNTHRQTETHRHSASHKQIPFGFLFGHASYYFPSCCCFSCFCCCFSSFSSVFFSLCFFFAVLFAVVVGFVTVSFHCLLLHFNHLLGALCLHGVRTVYSRQWGRGGTNSRLQQGSRADRGLRRGGVKRTIRAAHFIFVGAAATGSLGQH